MGINEVLQRAIDRLIETEKRNKPEIPKQDAQKQDAAKEQKPGKSKKELISYIKELAEKEGIDTSDIRDDYNTVEELVRDLLRIPDEEKERE